MAEHITIPTEGDLIAGKYRIIDELGRGSYGIVFRAQQLGVDRDVALKTLLPQAFLNHDVVERFQREATMVSRLHHANIVTLFDFGTSEGGALYMAMELVHGKPLSRVVTEEAPLVPDRALRIVTQVLRALSAAHAKGIIHRDLKPENIILTTGVDGEEIVKILDFGIAKLAESNQDALKTLTAQGYVLGTPHYMSPENITGDPISDRSDLYAVGILLYELLAGHHPYDAASPSAVLVRHLNDPLPVLPDAQMDRSRLGHVMRYALAKEPDERIESAEVFIEMLDGRRSPPKTRGGAPSSAKLALAIVALALGVIVLGVWAITIIINEPDSLATHDDAATLIADVGIIVLPNEVLTAVDNDAGRAVTDGGQADPIDLGDSGPDTAEIEALISDVGTAPEPDTSKKAPSIAKEKTRDKNHVVSMTLKFASDPPNATVTVGGRPVGSTPCSTNVKGNDPVRVRFTKIGYKAKTVVVKPTNPKQTVSVTLKPGRIKLLP